MNHLEQLVSEWLQHNGYFVRVSVPVGRRPNGGYEGELDVVAIHLGKQHLLHVECSLDALPNHQRETRFKTKFERGRKFISEVFQGLILPDSLEPVLVLQFGSANVRQYGGARMVTVRELVHEIFAGLQGTSPASKAVPSNLPLLRTLQLARDAVTHPASSSGEHRLLMRL